LSELNEEEADAFFRNGDAGTYEGGPAVSLAPVVAPEPFDEHQPRSAEHLARRNKLKRVVTAVVGSLGAGLLLVGVWRLARTDDAASVAPSSMHATVSASPLAGTGPTERAAAPAVAPAIVDFPAPASEAQSALVVSPVARSSLGDPAARSIPRRALRSGRARIMVAHVTWGPAGIARRSALGARYVPPTATFPDVHH
jgi:hypothetical protein